MPGESILGWTLEKITTPPSICGWLEGRSTFARVGLMVHISASFMQPGLDNNQCLEMTNFSPNPMLVMPGTRICQYVFQRTIGEARYEGKFRDQRAAS
jgi:dCTP deaminase